MKWTRVLFTTLLFVGLSAKDATAQTVTITKIDTSVAGQITVTTQVALPANWDVAFDEAEARPPKGVAGKGGVKGAKDTGGGIWVATITGLTSKNMYDVQAVLVTQNDKGVRQNAVFSGTSTITVK